MREVDVLVIGGGPGGYTAALRAAQNGRNTVLIEKKELGGTCLNRGCVPTKSLIADCEVLRTVRNASRFGVELTGDVSVNWPGMRKRMVETIENLRAGVAFLLKSAGVPVISGGANFLSERTVQVAGEVVRAKNIILAVGSEPSSPSFVTKHKRVLNSDELLSIPEIPQSLLILGGGVIACEFACLFAELGTEVVIAEKMDTILPAVDREISRTLSMYLKRGGIEIRCGLPFSNLEPGDDAVRGKIGDESFEAEYFLTAVGRKPCADSLKLAAAGIAVDERGWIPVDEYCRTRVPGIYAVGDAVGKWQLAHAASAMALTAADHIAGTSRPFDGKNIPNCIFTFPEIGTIGLTKEQCAASGIAVRIGKFPFAASGRAAASGETEGFVKIIADAQSDRVLGIHIIGPRATDLIAEASPVLAVGMTARELGFAVHAHPTFGEAVMEAARAVHGESVSLAASKRK